MDKGVNHCVEQARLVKAVTASQYQCEAQFRADSTAKVHGEPVVLPGSDWMGLMDQFRAKYGMYTTATTGICKYFRC